jgi:amino acid transporter
MTTSRSFQRSMKILGVLLLTLSAITPASSVFVIIPQVIQQAGTGAIWSLIIAAGVSLAMCFVYAELASAWPLAGGEYAMAGQALGPFAGYVMMGCNAFAYTFVAPSLALGVASYLTAIWPGAPPIPIAVAIISVSSLLCILNIRLNAWVTGAFLAVEVLALAAVALLGFDHVVRPIGEVLAHPIVATGKGLAPTPLVSIGVATTVAIFAYNGYGGAVYFSEEMHEAPRRIARTIIIAYLVTISLEFLPSLAAVLAAPDVAAFIQSQTPFGDIVTLLGGRRFGVVMSLGVALAIINAVIATLLVNARILYSSGRDGAWHNLVNDLFTRLHVRFDSPWAATLVSGAFCAASCFIPLHMLLVINGTGVTFIYLSLALAVIVARLTGTSAHAPYRMPLFPLAPAVALISLVGVLGANWMDPDVGRPSLLVLLSVMAVFAGYYLLRRRGGRFSWSLAGAEASPPLTPTAQNLELTGS